MGQLANQVKESLPRRIDTVARSWRPIEERQTAHAGEGRRDPAREGFARGPCTRSPR